MSASAFAQKTPTAHVDRARRRSPRRIAYVMSRFPKLTETFVLYELIALRDRGVEIEIHPLLRARNSSAHPEGAGLVRKVLELFRKPDRNAVMHPEALRLLDEVHVRAMLSPRIVLANLTTALTRPARYFGALAALVRSNVGSANYLLGGLAIFPKTVAAARDMERSGVEHVHAHFANHPAAAAFVIRRLTDIPYSFTAHGADLQVDQHMLREKVAESSFTATISEANRRFLIEHCGSVADERVRVVRCGVDTELFEQARRLAPRREGPLRILCIGTLYPVKGHPVLLEACRCLVRAGIDFECHLVGDGPDREALAALADELGVARRVRFRGPMPRASVAREIACADVLVVPSVATPEGRREGIPVVCMEGMAAGAAVVASAISGIPEIIDDGVNGLLVPARDPDALAAALLRLHAEPALRRRLAMGGLETVREQYDVRRNAERLLAHIEEVHR